MRYLPLATATIVIIASTGAEPPRFRHRTPTPDEPAIQWKQSLRRVFQLRQQRRLNEAWAQLQPDLERARRYPSDWLAGLTYVYAGNLHFVSFRFQDATASYLQARRIGAELQDGDLLRTANHNLSNLYLSAFASDQATLSAERITAAETSADIELPIPLLLHQARLASRSKDWTKAQRLFGEALHWATMQPRREWEATAWEWLGEEHRLRQELPAAEEALSQALRLRKLHKDPDVLVTLHRLAELRLAQKRFPEALRSADAALQNNSTESPVSYIQYWHCLQDRAQAYWELGQRPQAVVDLEDAVRAMRLHAMPADALRIAAVSTRHETGYLPLVEYTARLYQETGDRQYLLQSLAAAESSRALSLRMSSGSARRRQAVDSYWAALSELQARYRQLYLGDSAKARRGLKELQLRLAELEASEHRDRDAVMPAGELTPREMEVTRAPQDYALLVFHLGPSQSYLWTRPHNGAWEVHTLPNAGILRKLSQDFVSQLRAGSFNSGLSRQLYQTLFGKLSPAVRAQPHWLLVPDDQLFRMPFAALATSDPADPPRYLVEDHSLQLLSGTWMLSAGKPGKGGPWIGFGDPVYNAADPRIPARGRLASFLSQTRYGAAASTFELPRLPGTSRELELAVQAWGSGTTLHTGPDATLATLDSATRRQPAVLHLATHVLPAPHNPDDSLLALALANNGTPEYVGPEWISSRDLQAELVVMSGCRSGSGQLLPGEGLLGLARSWLAAGARRVVATHWPLLDDSGEFWKYFYSDFRSGIPAAAALRRTQLMLRHSSGWQSHPSVWAAYFVIGQR
jgi:CHAT domain-containing protein/tetratricopeptide (TPR) repeat protein